MKISVSAFTLALVWSTVSVDANVLHLGELSLALASRHSHINARRATSLEARAPVRNRRRCQPEADAAPAQASNSNAQPVNVNNNNNNNNSGGGGGGGGDLLWSDQCGGSHPTSEPSSEGGPNGSIEFLNCGVMAGGWEPPFVTLQELKTVSLQTALAMPGSPFQACAAYIPIFESVGGQLQIPPILLASIAVQESSCRPWVVGQGGEQGLMQITQEKCAGAPGGNCLDEYFNIFTGANYLLTRLNGNNGNIIRTLGNYNGWPVGMTQAYATAAAYSDCCRCQNDMDYLNRVVNGLVLGRVIPGKYNNLAVCG